MTVQTFRDMLARRPFQPVSLLTSAGERFEIRHPELAHLSRTAIFIGVDVADGIPTEYRIVSFLHIVAIEPIVVQTA